MEHPINFTYESELQPGGEQDDGVMIICGRTIMINLWDSDHTFVLALDYSALSGNITIQMTETEVDCAMKLHDQIVVSVRGLSSADRVETLSNAW